MFFGDGTLFAENGMVREVLVNDAPTSARFHDSLVRDCGMCGAQNGDDIRHAMSCEAFWAVSPRVLREGALSRRLGLEGQPTTRASAILWCLFLYRALCAYWGGPEEKVVNVGKIIDACLRDLTATSGVGAALLEVARGGRSA